MIIICTDNEGFEDQLTLGQDYRPNPIYKTIGENSYLIYDDKGIVRWFGESHFKIVVE